MLRQLLNPHLGRCEYIGLDGSPLHDYISHLRKTYFRAEDVRFAVADLTADIPLETKSVDFVYCSEVIEHLLEPESLFKQIARVLKPGGYLLLTTPNKPNVFQKAFWLPSARESLEQIKQQQLEKPERFIVDGREVRLYGHVSCRTNRQWDQELAALGFKLIDYRRGAITYGSSPFHDSNLSLGLKFLTEAVLDALPKSWTRSFSEQLIALYQCGQPEV